MKKTDKKHSNDKFLWEKSNILQKIYIYEIAKIKSNTYKKRTIRKSSEIRNQHFPSTFDNLSKFKKIYTIINSPYAEQLHKISKNKEKIKKCSKISENKQYSQNISLKKSQVYQQKTQQIHNEKSIEKSRYHQKNVRTCIRSYEDSLPYIQNGNISYVDRIVKVDKKSTNNSQSISPAYKNNERKGYMSRRSSPIQIIQLEKRIEKILSKYVVKSSNVSTYVNAKHKQK